MDKREVECRDCDGRGRVTVESDRGDVSAVCEGCNGSGRVTMAEDEDWDD